MLSARTPGHGKITVHGSGAASARQRGPCVVQDLALPTRQALIGLAETIAA
jgi:hypothetical protein